MFDDDEDNGFNREAYLISGLIAGVIVGLIGFVILSPVFGPTNNDPGTENNRDEMVDRPPSQHSTQSANGEYEGFVYLRRSGTNGQRGDQDTGSWEVYGLEATQNPSNGELFTSRNAESNRQPDRPRTDTMTNNYRYR